jgi:hypothetical protein
MCGSLKGLNTGKFCSIKSLPPTSNVVAVVAAVAAVKLALIFFSLHLYSCFPSLINQIKITSAKRVVPPPPPARVRAVCVWRAVLAENDSYGEVSVAL